MNKSFENRFGMVYTNKNASKLSSRQKMRFAMRRFRALGLNEEEPHRYENRSGYSATPNPRVERHLHEIDKLIERCKAINENDLESWKSIVPVIQDAMLPVVFTEKSEKQEERYKRQLDELGKLLRKFAK